METSDKPTTNTIQIEIEKRATEKLKKEIYDAHLILYRGSVNDLIERTGLRINIGTSEKPKNIKVESMFNNDNFGTEMFNSNIQFFIAKETELFLKEVKNKPIISNNTSKSPAKQNPKILERIAEKNKERQYLYNFLMTCYKGSDAKLKVERELAVIDSEIKALQFALPFVEEDPFN